MKKRKGVLFCTLVACILALCSAVLFGCAPEEEGQKQVSIQLDYSNVQLIVGETITLHADVVGTTEEIVWTSSDATVAHVDGGIVTALAVGETEIVASAGGANAVATVTVTDRYAPVLSLGRDSVELAEGGEPFTLTATVTYGGKNVVCDIEWESGNSSVATVSDGVITPVGVGETTVTATASYLNQQAQDSVKVIVVSKTNVSLSRDAITMNLVNEQDKTAKVTASMTIDGEPVTDATYTVKAEGNAATASVKGNEITVTAVQIGEATIIVTAAKEDVSVTTRLLVTVERANVPSEQRFVVNTHIGDVPLDLPYSDAMGIYVKDKLVSVTGSPLTLSSDWLIQQEVGSTVEAQVRLPDRNAVITLEFADEMRNVRLQATIDGVGATVSPVQDGEGFTGFSAGEQVQEWKTAPGQSNWNGATLEATIDGSRGDMNGFDWWIFDIVFTGEGSLGDQNGDWLYFILSYGNVSTVTFRDGGASREGLNIYKQDGTELLTMPERNVRYTVVLSITDWVKSGEYVVLGHYTNDMVCYVGNNFVCSDAYYLEHVRDAFLKISLDESEKELYVNGSFVLNADIQAGTSDEVVWTSSDETVATVEDGVVTAVGKGTAVITATVGDKAAHCTVVVKNKLELQLEPSRIIDLVEENTQKIEATFRVNGELFAAAAVSFESEDSEIATVEQDGTVIGVAAGSTRICVTVTYDGETVEKFVEVTVVKSTYLAVSQDRITLRTRGEAGDIAAMFTAQMYLNGAEADGATYQAESDSEIVRVETDGNEITVIAAGKTGTATITVTASRGDDEVSVSVEVTVERGVIAAGSVYTVNTHFGDQMLDLTEWGEVLSIYDGETVVSTDQTPSAISAEYLAQQANNSEKKLTAKFEQFDVVLTVRFVDEVRSAKLYGSVNGTSGSVTDLQDGAGFTGFTAGEQVQVWTTAPGIANWDGSTVEAKIGNQSGDMTGYDWWIFDIVFTGEGALGDQNGTLLCIMPQFDFGQSVDFKAGGATKDWLHIYDESGKELLTMPERNVRYTVAVSLTGRTVVGQYIAMVHYTPDMVCYVGNSIACSNSYYEEHFLEKFSRVTLNREMAELYVNEQLTLDAHVQIVDGEVVWTSDNEAVATVENGVVTAIAKGTAVITATVGNKVARCTVEVKDKLELTLGFSQVTLYEEGTKKIETQLRVNGGEAPEAIITYGSEDPDIATVGQDGTITGVASGKTRIIVTAEYNGTKTEKLIEVEVLSVTRVDVSEESVAIYTRSDVGNEDMPTSVSVTATMYVDGSPVQAEYSAKAENDALVGIEVNGNTVIISSKGTAAETVIVVTAVFGDHTVQTDINVTVERGMFTSDLPLEATTWGGDQALDLSDLGDVQAIFDGNTQVSLADAPSTLSAEWLKTQASGKEKQLIARFEQFDAVISVLIDEMHSVTMSRLPDSWPEIGNVQSGEGIPGFGADDTVQLWRTGSGAGWVGSTAEAKFGGNRGDMAVYDWWIFDLVFTKEVTPDENGVWLWFYLCSGNTAEVNFTKDGPSNDAVHIYDEAGQELIGLPQPGERYTVVVHLAGHAVDGQYIVVGHHTVEMVAYIGNNIACLDEYYREQFAPKFSPALSEDAEQPQATPMAVLPGKNSFDEE